MPELLEKLNQSQSEAVTTTEGYVRVIAGAGSGKTRALSHRFAYLVEELGILPGHILCVTFTNKSANEMRQRIHNLTGDQDTGYINTFHGFCVSVLQEDSYAVQYPKNFLVLDNSDIDDMLKLIYEERNLSLRDMTYSNARDMFEMRKLKEDPGYYKDLLDMSPEALKEKYDEAKSVRDILFYGYLYQEKKCFGLDYNDLIVVTLHIFREHADIREKWQQRLEYIMIDEFQDIDPPQYELMKVLADYHKNLFVVGDPDQTIYSWRGADARYLLDFDVQFPGTRTIFMNENYRSTPEILAVVNSLIDTNTLRIKKDLIPMRDKGESVFCYIAKDAEDEADWLTGEILALRGAGVPYRDITVLYRAHYVTRTLEQALMHEPATGKPIPYTIYSGTPFYGRMEIKDALSYLRMLLYRDDLSFRRICNVPKRNLGKRRMQFLEQYARDNQTSLYVALYENLEHELIRNTKARQFVTLIEKYAEQTDSLSVSELLSKIMSESGYEEMLRTEGAQDRLDNLAELKQAVFEYETTCGEEAELEDYLRHVALYTNADADAGSEDKIRLMTVHAAKGLEFKYVFLCSLNEGIFPSRKIKTLEEMEEERRLAFVAMTRAKDRLYLSCGEGTHFDGIPRYPSRFIFDIRQDLLEYAEEPEERLVESTRRFIESESKILKVKEERELFEPGQRVEHAVFGPGTILDLNGKEGCYHVKFDRIETARVISFKVKMKALSDSAG